MENNTYYEEMGVEVVGITRPHRSKSKSKPPKSITASTTAKLQKLATSRRKRALRLSSEQSYLVPSVDTLSGADGAVEVEISLQGIPRAPAAEAVPPRVKHPAGTVLHPPITISSSGIDDDGSGSYDDNEDAGRRSPLSVFVLPTRSTAAAASQRASTTSNIINDYISSQQQQQQPRKHQHQPRRTPRHQQQQPPVRPHREIFAATDVEVLHVDGDPFPPCFRVVGVSPLTVPALPIAKAPAPRTIISAVSPVPSSSSRLQQQQEPMGRSPIANAAPSTPIVTQPPPPPPSNSPLNLTNSSTLTDEQDFPPVPKQSTRSNNNAVLVVEEEEYDDDDESAMFVKRRDSFLQLNIGNNNNTSDNDTSNDTIVGTTTEVFRDEEDGGGVGGTIRNSLIIKNYANANGGNAVDTTDELDTTDDVNAADVNNVSIAESQMSTTKNYLALTKQLIQQRKARERRQLQQKQEKKQQRSGGGSDTSRSTSTSGFNNNNNKCCGFFGGSNDTIDADGSRRPGISRVWLCLVLILGIGCLLLILAVTQFDIFGADSSTNANAAQLQQDYNSTGSIDMTPTDASPTPVPQQPQDQDQQQQKPQQEQQPLEELEDTNLIDSSANHFGPLLISDFPESTRDILATDDPIAPQVLAYQWLLDDPSIGIYPRWQQVQRMALATLYYSTNGPSSWKEDSSSWLSYQLSECEWYPQACDSNGKLRRLLLSDHNLDGTLPAEMFWLTSLQQVQLYDNPLLRGSIPGNIGNLEELQVLWIQNCGLAASADSYTAIPTEIGQLGGSLVYLDVSGNPLGHRGDRAPEDGGNKDDGLYNDIPTQLGLLTNLQELILSKADLIGTLPSEIGNLSRLQYSFQLQGNAIHGSLPTQLGNLELLEHFYAEENHFSGSLPSEIGGWAKIKIFDLSVNHLDGGLPSVWGAQLESIQELWLYDNMLASAIPEQWGLLSESLTALDLSMNQLQDSLPTELGRLVGLTGLWLYQNQFQGKIPSEIGNLNENLLQLSLFANDLNGRMPEEMGSLRKLRGLWLDDNMLTGEIPPGLLMSTSMLSLHLFNNQLKGSLPSFPRNPYYALQDLRLDKNLLTGTIPPSIGNLHVNLQFLQLQQNEFYGTLPSELSALTNLVTLDVIGNELTGAVPWQVCSLKEDPEEQLTITLDCNEVSCDCECSCQ